jgi:hypothetical protein
MIPQTLIGGGGLGSCCRLIRFYKEGVIRKGEFYGKM